MGAQNIDSSGRKTPETETAADRGQAARMAENARFRERHRRVPFASKELHRLFNHVAEQPLPDEFKDLLQRIEAQSRH